jgi:dolichol-phosphate mannosyltransferase
MNSIDDIIIRAVPVVSVVIPTFNEAGNVRNVVSSIGDALDSHEWEIIFVDDDSSDETARLVSELAREDGRVRLIRRFGRRGLSTACIEGVFASTAPFVAVMDADGQHDERLLGGMLSTLLANKADIVIGSRFVEGGGVGEWSGARQLVSRVATRISHRVIGAELKDPMSGFFMARRELFEASVRRMSGQGFKILVDLFASLPTPPRFTELPYTFRLRQHGESKLDSKVITDYLSLVLDKTVGRVVPTRFIMFGMVGAIGVIVHLATLKAGLVAGASFALAQTLATLVAMTFNFALNNIFTYRDMRLRGMKLVRGFIVFSLICSLGGFANVGVASLLFGQHTTWWLAGLSGALVGSVFNFAMTSTFTWRVR